MTLKTVAIVAALALVLVSAAASAQVVGDWRISGNQLKTFCHGGDALYGRGICLGFATAVAAIVGGNPAGWRACFPDGVTGLQLQDIMVKFLDDNPEKLHLIAVSLAARAFEKAFPCPK